MRQTNSGMDQQLRRQEILVCHLGRADYEITWNLQKRLQARLIEAKRSGERPLPPHILLTVEHPPVFTIGKSGNRANLLFNAEALAKRGATFFEIDRGGDITFHGPGQLVVYPILDLDRYFTDIHRYLRELEQAVMHLCGDYGVDGGVIEQRTGVWIGPDENGPERKICAMGIRCSRWVTMHGLALNVSTDLSFFDMIVPCGIRDRGVTSLEREVGGKVDPIEVRDRLTDYIAERFVSDIRVTEGQAARDTLDAFIHRSHVVTEA